MTARRSPAANRRSTSAFGASPRRTCGAGVSQVFVTTSPPDPRVIGYYTLSGTSFSRDELAPDLARRLPRYFVPAAIIGRLAVERSRQRQGFGERLLVDAFDRIREASRSIAVYAIVVDAKNDAVRRFYEAYGFRSFVTAPLRSIYRWTLSTALPEPQ